VRRLEVALSDILDSLRATARKLDLDPRWAVRGHLTEDLRAIGRLRVLPTSKKVDPHDLLFEVSDAFGSRGGAPFKPWCVDGEHAGPWFQGSMMFAPGAGRKYEARYVGLQQVQSFATKSEANFFFNLRFEMWDRLKAVGYPHPLEYLFKVGVSVDGSSPFYRKDPPV
jgi:hypothetical protein